MKCDLEAIMTEKSGTKKGIIESVKTVDNIENAVIAIFKIENNEIKMRKGMNYRRIIGLNVISNKDSCQHLDYVISCNRLEHAIFSNWLDVQKLGRIDLEVS
ncbi:22007_t:CDS:2 [Gigaspora margarita]|uniref:22007_t:CDS:1 n=1 Tax=Gigaspora margarita TaxID=4874 RepID=A0ABN7UGB7_GIGMA|nr:22007_t:CDS:2 [Gigaspora margarita]